MSTEAANALPESAPVPQRYIARIPAILVVIALLATAAFAYWRFIYYPSTPAYVVAKIIDAGRAKDYQSVFDLIRLTGPLKALVRSPEDLRRYAEQFPGLIPDVSEYEIRDWITRGDKATVNTHVTSTQGGRTTVNEVYFELVRQGGVWRLDGEWLFREAVRHGLGGALLGGAEE